MPPSPDAPSVGTQQVPSPPPAAMAPGDMAGMAVLLVLVALFAWVGFRFVSRRRAANLEALTQALEGRGPPNGEQESDDGAGDDDDEAGRGDVRPVVPALEEGERPLEPPPEPASAPVAVPAARGPAPAQGPEDEDDDEETARALQRGLEKTRTGFLSRLNAMLLGGRKLDDKLAEELESALIQADVGVRTAGRLLALVKEHLRAGEAADPEKVKEVLRKEMLAILDLPAADLAKRTEHPCVVMVVGVNGTGKTTTIGKLAHQLVKKGKRVVLGAGDTFRAAATEQLEVWGERAGVPVVSGKEGQDPSSVVFEAVKQAKAQGADFAIADTAGRLHTKVNLMEELKKARRVLDKAHAGAPHEVLLVVDATTGQNAVIQAEQFHQALGLTGIVLTKLDGTAKGGVVIAICDLLKVPIRYVGVGEGLDDLKRFHARAFVDSLLS